jgi:UDP-N-acetyl-D-galactosamine dehydrogenase
MKIIVAELKIAVIGLGYVGLPLAALFASSRKVVGYDINQMRIQELKNGNDSTNEVSETGLASVPNLKYTSSESDLEDINCYIVTVPTPVDEHKQPDLSPIISATETIAKYLRKGDIVIYESTVYPGCTEEICVPILEEIAKLKFNIDFFCGYSPERINPGDKTHRVENIVKITSGSTPEIAKIVDKLYSSVIKAGTHRAESIKIAEAAKVIENTQRDINIALVNEFAIIFNKLGLDTLSVLEAAGTKWNFLPFRPGLVGGHCIGVDPYYLTHKAQAIGYNPELILAGRRINDKMGSYVANKLIKAMSLNGMQINTAHVLIMGATFKENCPDLRNSKVIDIVSELKEYGISVAIHDPVADVNSVYSVYGLKPEILLKAESYDALIIAVGHEEYKKMGDEAILRVAKKKRIIYDLKGVLNKRNSDLRL